MLMRISCSKWILNVFHAVNTDSGSGLQLQQGYMSLPSLCTYCQKCLPMWPPKKKYRTYYKETFNNVGDIILALKDLPKWQHVSYNWWEYALKSDSFISEWTCRRTTDAIFILYTLIQSLNKKKKLLYASFIDSTKAFDSSHSLLWKMSSLGLSRKTWTCSPSPLLESPRSYPIRIAREQGRDVTSVHALLFSLLYKWPEKPSHH